jgi:hypothetical protein
VSPQRARHGQGRGSLQGPVKPGPLRWELHGEAVGLPPARVPYDPSGGPPGRLQNAACPSPPVPSRSPEDWSRSAHRRSCRRSLRGQVPRDLVDWADWGSACDYWDHSRRPLGHSASPYCQLDWSRRPRPDSRLHRFGDVPWALVDSAGWGSACDYWDRSQRPLGRSASPHCPALRGRCPRPSHPLGRAPARRSSSSQLGQ